MNLEELANKKNADVSDIVEYLESKGCRIPSYGQYELSMDELRCVDYKMLREECTRLRELTITDNIITHALVDNIADLGIFVNFPNGKKGLIHYSQIKNWNIDEAKSRYSKNQWIKVFVLSIREDGKINLSLKKLTKVDMEAEQERRKVLAQKYASKFERGAIYEAEVVELSKHEARISINGIDGYIEKDELNWNEINSFKDSLFEEEVIHAVFLEYKEGKLLFGLKYLNEKPYDDNLYDLSLSDLLKYAGHDSNVFIGQAKQYHYGLFIENLYSTNTNQRGRLLIDPVFGYNLRAIVPNANFNVEENKYYKIELKLAPKNKRLERNQLFQFVAINIEETENPYKADVILTFAKSTSPRDCAALAHTLAEVGKNMYSSKDRMFFELVQNADDAAAQKGVYINVKTQGDFLVVRHNGYSFDKDDFDAITSSANGTKKANENKTGYKGIGFKSVFTDSEIVFIKTGGYQFKFDRDEPIFTDFERFYFFVNGIGTDEQRNIFLQKYSSERSKFRGVSDIPWQLEPIWIDDYPNELGDDFTQSNVAIALKLGEYKISGDNGYDKAIVDIISNPRFMLFLRNTKRIDFNGLSVSKTIKDGIITLKNSFGKKRIECFKREDFEIEVNNTVFSDNDINVRIVVEEQDEVSGKIIEAKFVDTHNHEIESIPKKIAINRFTTLSFAVLIDENRITKPNTKCNEISMFAFLPTLVKDFKFPFYINANFILDPPRQRILGDNPWNFYLMQEIARHLVQWSASLNERQDKNALNILLPKYFEEDGSDTKQLAEHFNTAYKSAIESEAFILNHKGELAKQDEIIIDDTGLSEIMGEEQFCEFIETDYCLPSKKIDSEILSRPIFTEIIHIDSQYIEDYWADITFNPFKKWYNRATDIQKDLFVSWLVKSKDKFSRIEIFNEIVNDLPLFQFGEEYKSFVEISSFDYIVTTEHIIPIKEILSKLGFVCSDNLFDDSHPLYEFVDLQEEEDLFDAIKKCDFFELTTEERKSLFFALADFDGVGEAKLRKEIALFRNMNGDFKPLGEMVAYRENVPVWLKNYVLCKEDNSTGLLDYLIAQKDEFKSIIQENISDIDTSWADLYNTYKEEWTGQFTRQIIDKYKIDNDLLSIIEESDTETKKHFLNKIEKLELFSTSTYKKDSYEYRVLQLALSAFEEPSNFSSKIFFDGQCIKNFSVSDDVVCEYTLNGVKKKVKMSLAKLLPQYQNQSDSIDKIKALFESKKDLDKFFVTKPIQLYQIVKELEKEENLGLKPGEWNYDRNGNAHQYLFYVFYFNGIKEYTSSWVISIQLEKESDFFIHELLDFIYDNNIDIMSSPFTFRVKQYFNNKYFNCEWLFEKERLLPIIEKWASDDKKKKYLTDNGVRTEGCYALQFRKLFLENKPIDFIDKLKDDEINSGIKFIATATGFERPFVGENQKKVLLSLKDKCNDLSDNWDEDKMVENSKEWNTKEYNEWIEDLYPQIYIYEGLLPSRLSYKDELLLNYEDSDYNYYYNKDKRELFVTSTKEIKDILFVVAKDGKSDIDIDDYKSLCWGEDKVPVSKAEIEEKEKKIESLSEENRRKDDIIEELQAKLKAYENVEIGNNDEDKGKQRENLHTPTIEKGNSGSIGDIPQLKAQLEAQRRLMQDFPQWTFPDNYGEADDDGKPYNFSTVEIEDENDNTIPIVLKSYKKTDEPFKINTTEWDYLIKEKAVLLIYIGSDIKRVYVNDLIRKQANIAITFSTENLDIEDKVNAFADSLHYFNELHFDFDSFNISSRVQSAKELYQRNKRAFFANDNTEDDI